MAVASAPATAIDRKACGLPVDARGPGQARAGFPAGVAHSARRVLAGESSRPTVEHLVGRGWSVTTLAQLAERELQRIPRPVGVSQWLLFAARIAKPAASL